MSGGFKSAQHACCEHDTIKRCRQDVGAYGSGHTDICIRAISVASWWYTHSLIDDA